MALPQIGLSSALHFYLALRQVDRPNQYDGLWVVATQYLGLDPEGGALFVFTNKNCDRIKLLQWDGTGVWFLVKRLEQRSLIWPATPKSDPHKLTLETSALTVLLDGIDLKDDAKKARYER